jgi:hypothetical protein
MNDITAPLTNVKPFWTVCNTEYILFLISRIRYEYAIPKICDVWRKISNQQYVENADSEIKSQSRHYCWDKRKVRK